MYSEFERIDHALNAAQIDGSAAEVHGMLCGLLGALENESAVARWMESLVRPDHDLGSDLDDCLSMLNDLAEETTAALDGESPGFPLLLPADEAPLQRRGEAVRDWSQGFLYGFGLTETPRRRLSERAQEVLNDLAEFTRLDVDGIGLGDDEENEEEEESLMEITEFLWVATTLLREEIMGGVAPEPEEAA